MKRAVKKRNIWPFGKGQLLGSRSTVYRVKKAGTGRRAAPVSAAASAREEKARDNERLQRKVTDPELQRKLKAHYARGGNLHEFLAQNPGVSKAQFMRVARRNPPVYVVMGEHYATRFEAIQAAKKKARLLRRDVVVQDAWGQSEVVVTPKGHSKPISNPASGAASVYEGFHGTPSKEVVTVKGKQHYHEHLAALGKLAYFKVAGVDEHWHTLKDFKGALLCSNETRNQLFIEGGDQSLDLAVFGIKKPHEVETLGQITEIGYRTTKHHLGKEGGKALYFHETGEDGGTLPDLLYRVRDQHLEISGGSYTIEDEGIEN